MGVSLPMPPPRPILPSKKQLRLPGWASRISDLSRWMIALPSGRTPWLKQIEQDRRAGLIPCFVCATLGTTSSNAIDPLPEIGQICRREGLWLHVDAAMIGTAAICPEYRYIHAGMEFADSYCFNPHKWMFTNFDCDCFYVADRAVLINTLSVLPEYLRNQATESGAVIDYRDWQISLGQTFPLFEALVRHPSLRGGRVTLPYSAPRGTGSKICPVGPR